MRKFRFDSINFLNQHARDRQIKLRLVNSLVRSIFVMWLISVWHLDDLISCCAIKILINIGSNNACCRTPHDPMVTYLYPCDGGVAIADQNQGLFCCCRVISSVNKSYGSSATTAIHYDLGSHFRDSMMIKHRRRWVQLYLQKCYSHARISRIREARNSLAVR